MSERLTVGSFKTRVNWTEALNMSPSDPRWLQLLNEALYRLLIADLYVGSTQRYNICTRSACLTWPRQFEAIYAMSICGRPLQFRNGWFEFLEAGPGLSSTGGCSMNHLDRQSGFVMFDDVTVASKIRIYRDSPADAGKTVTIRGFDSNGQWVMTDSGSTVGERVVLDAPYKDTITIWAPQVFREVLKDPTTGYLRAYSYDATLPVPPQSPGASDTPMKALAVWEPSETLPNYRRSKVDMLATDDCTNFAVQVVAKIAFIPVSADLDFLWTSNFAALKLAMISIQKELRGDYEGARLAWNGTFDPLRRRFYNGAIPLMEEELENFNGPSLVIPMRRVGPGANVENLI